MTNVAWIILQLFGLALIGAIAARSVAGRILVYGGSFILCAGFIVEGFAGLTDPAQRLVLPLGLPWIGTNLRLDALSGFFSFWLASEAPAPACSPSATAGTRRIPDASCRSTRPSWPPWRWSSSPTTRSPSCSLGN